MLPRSDASAGSSACGCRSVISPAPSTSTAMPPVSRSASGRRSSGTGTTPSLGARSSPITLKVAVVASGSMKLTRSVPGRTVSQSATVAPETRLTRRVSGMPSVTAVARPEMTSTRTDGAQLRRVLAEAHQVRDAAAHAQRLVGPALVDAAAPREGERFVAASVRDPPALAAAFRGRRDPCVAHAEVDAHTRHRQRDLHRRRGCRRDDERFDRCGRGYREHDVQREHRPPALGQQHVRRRLIDQRDGPAIDARVADEQAIGHLDAHPALLQHVDRHSGRARDRARAEREVVVDACHSRVHRRRGWRRVDRKRLRAKRAVVVDRNDDPAVGTCRVLSGRDRRRGDEQQRSEQQQACGYHGHLVEPGGLPPDHR